MTSRTADGIQGTTWWDVDTSQVPSDVDAEEWAALARISLAGLPKQLNGTRKDWTGLHTLLGAVPAGRWTTYGDVAAVIGSHAVPVGRHLGARGQCPSPWRVLNAAGRVGDGFQWTDQTRTDTPAEILSAEGVRFDGAVADAEMRLGQDALRQLLDS
ncbi:MGMT family protein [Streptomyces sp. 061-3]|uniref:MGMT family protein n=1 Tax=Streptomyces sp. 061-3 TaxID=2789268 RepID=UPI00397F5266